MGETTWISVFPPVKGDPFRGDRLRQAREVSGLTVNALAEKSGCSALEIEQLEREQIDPRAHTLQRLSLGTGFPISFFYKRGKAPELMNIHWNLGSPEL